MVLEIWRHRPTGNHYAVYLEEGEIVLARGPMNPKEAAALTTTGFGEAESDAALVQTLSSAPWEYNPVWQQNRLDHEDAEWMESIAEPDEEGRLP